MRLTAVIVVACVACSKHAAGLDDASDNPSDASALPPPIDAADFPNPLDEASIRALQTWIDDPTFATKWTSMLSSPIKFLGGADSAFHADLATRAVPLPGGEVLCHGDAKLTNFGWVLAIDKAGFSDVDFDDAGACPAAADILHFLAGTELEFGNAALDDAALDAYIDTVAGGAAAVAIDTSGAPDWTSLHATNLDSDTSKGLIKLGGSVQAASSAEVTAIAALVAADPRFPTTIVDVARHVKTDGGDAGLRQFWVLIQDAQHPLTIMELKESTTPGTELGPHSTTYDGDDRFDTLKLYWWGAGAPADHFGVTLLGSHFLARDRYGYLAADDSQLSESQVDNALLAEASLIAQRHRGAWAGIDPVLLRAWLRASAATVAARWRASYLAAGGA